MASVSQRADADGSSAGRRGYDELLKTVALPHYFASAFDRRQVYRYLPLKLDVPGFESAVRALVDDQTLHERDGCLYLRPVDGDRAQRQVWSRDLFRRHARWLRLLVRLPGVRFVGLSGANAFESCSAADDIDLFVVTAADRLWLTFISMITLSRAIGRRDLFCINYLVDERHLRIPHESYYTAVQLMSMVPVIDRGVSAALLDANPWVFEHLPNAPRALAIDPFYALEPFGSAAVAAASASPLVAAANRRLYQIYAERLRRKYPQAFGRGIVVGEGEARLHRVDYANLYDQIAADGFRP